MNSHLEQLIDALRGEMQQYGEMLALLDLQKHLVVPRSDGDSVWTSIAAVEDQVVAIEEARRIRYNCERHLFSCVRMPQTAGFEDVLCMLPESHRPLLSALFSEIHQLGEEVHRIAIENHSQLQYSVTLMARFIAVFSLQAQSALLIRGSGHLPCLEVVQSPSANYL